MSKALSDNTVSPEEALQMMNDFVSGNQDMNKAAKNIEGMLGQIASTRTKAPIDPATAEHPMDTPPDVAAPTSDDTHRFISNPDEMPDLSTGFTNPTLDNVMQRTPDVAEQTAFAKPPDSSVIREPESLETPVPAPLMKNIDTSVIPNEEENKNAHLFMNQQRAAANAQQSMEMERAMTEPELPHEQDQVSLHGQPQEQAAFHQAEGPPTEQPQQQEYHEDERAPESRQQVMEKLNHFSTDGPPPPVDVYEGQIPDLNRFVHQEAGQTRSSPTQTGQTRSPRPDTFPSQSHHHNNINHQQHNNNLVMEAFHTSDDGYDNPQLNRNPGDSFRKIVSSGQTSMTNILDKMDPHEIAGQADPSLLKHGALDTSILEDGGMKNKKEDFSSMYSKPIGNIFGEDINNQPIGRPMPYGDSGFQTSGQFERKFRTPHPVKKISKLRKLSNKVAAQYTGKRRSKLSEMYEDSIFPEDNMDIASLEGDLQGKTLTNYDAPSRG